MKITMTVIIERQRALLYTQKSKKIAKRLFIQKARHVSKATQFPLRFYIEKAIHLTLQDFHEIFEVGIYIQNHDTVRYVTFLYTKS